MTANVNGISLYYEKTGSGPALILLHGNGEDHHIFDCIAEKLSANFTVYAVDSRNHGGSQKTDVYDYEAMAGDIYGFITALGLAPAYAAGFSDGAIVCLMLAMRRAEALKKMALLGVNLKPSDFTEENIAFIRETYAQTGDPLFRLMLEQPNIGLDDVRGVTVPALIIGGENDLFKPETFTNLAAALPNAELMIMAGHEHDTYITGTDLLCADFVRFFG